MLHDISWMQCLSGIAILTGGYYTVVVFGFFRKEFRAMFRRLAGDRSGSNKGLAEKE